MNNSYPNAAQQAAAQQWLAQMSDPKPPTADTDEAAAREQIRTAFGRAKELWLNDSSTKTLEEHEEDAIVDLLNGARAAATQATTQVQEDGTP